MSTSIIDDIDATLSKINGCADDPVDRHYTSMKRTLLINMYTIAVRVVAAAVYIHIRSCSIAYIFF